MNLLRGNLTQTNGLFLLCIAPLLVRIWIEAVVWRLNEGPQMLGFQVIHLAAGSWTVPLFVSLLILWLYQLWAAVIVVAALVPAWRRITAGKRFVVLGAGSVLVFFCVADFIQTELPTTAVYVGATAMAGLLLLLVWTALPRHSSRFGTS